MFRYTLVLLLLTPYFSESIPFTKINSVASSLHGLADQCKNPVLANQITGKIRECNVVVPPYNELTLQCLMFYDVNSRLCEALASSKLALTEDDYSTLINQPLDVQELCNETKAWEANKLSEYPSYKPTIQSVFKNVISCAKVCGVLEVTSQDSNFFCKYFKWGIGLLSQVHLGVTNSTNSNLLPIASHRAPNRTTSIIQQSHKVPTLSLPQNVSFAKDTTKDPSSVDSITYPVVKPLNGSNNDNLVTPEHKSSGQDRKEQETPEKIDANGTQEKPEEQIAAGDVRMEKEKEKAPPTPAAVQDVPNEDDMEKPMPAELPPVPVKPEIPEEKTQIEDVPIDTGKKGKNNIDQVKKSNPDADIDQVKKSNPDADLADDYPDSEDGKEGLGDTQGGDDGDDPILMDNDTKAEQVQTQAKVTANRVKSNNPSSVYSGEREIYASSYQEGYSDGDDHFFPFFLTGIISVALLYVLYHNKNKVSKVVLGLIVEGRQNGRRRNSRGHAYRRLDTLEQAMSAPTAAPPSKIIY